MFKDIGSIPHCSGNLFQMIIFSSKRNAQSLIALMAIQRAIAEGKEVFVATADVRETLKRMADNFPGALFEINNCGFKIWLKKPKPEIVNE